MGENAFFFNFKGRSVSLKRLKQEVRGLKEVIIKYHPEMKIKLAVLMNETETEREKKRKRLKPC